MIDIEYSNVSKLYSDLALNYGLENYKLTSCGLYSRYPKIFSTIFSTSSKENVDLFESLSKLFIDHILYIDQLCEGKVFSLDHTIEKYILGNELVHKLSYIFPEKSPFWHEYRKLYKEYFSALKKEDFYKNNHDINITKESYLTICKNKGSLSKLFVYAMALISDNLDLYIDIEEMLDNLDIYIQILDDFKDIKTDMSEEYFSYYTYKILKNNNICDYKNLINALLSSEKIEFLDDMKYYLTKTDYIFQKYKHLIPDFKEILYEQFKIVNLIESKVNKFVCK